MVKNLNLEQISVILDALPCEMMFVDENDTVRYGNKMETRVFRFNKDKIVGTDIRSCMSDKTQPKVEKILADFKSGKADEAEFWIPSLGPKILNQFIALRDKDGKYLGVLEYILDYNALEQIAEDKKDAPKV